MSEVTPPEVDPLRERLAQFFEHNADAQYKKTDSGAHIQRPWGDPTIILEIPAEAAQAEELLQALNAVYLPPRFSAIWHRDSKDAEFISPITPPALGLRSRSFEFQFLGVSYRCEWAHASQRLLAIGRAHSLSEPPSRTAHRNLGLFDVYFQLQKDHPEVLKTLGDAMSFWIRNVEWDENRVVELARHLNYYMHYYDRETPRIIIHEARPSDSAETSLRYPAGSFPAVIAGRALDSYLLTIWETTISPDPFKRFLYSYQILEYAAFYYLDDSTLGSIRRILLAPDAPARLNEAVQQIVDAVTQMKLAEPAKLANVVKALVDPLKLWKHIESNMNAFTQDVVFEGGFALTAICKPAGTLEDFKTTGFQRVADHFRNIRNALVHSREAKQLAAAIAPTWRNEEKLRPWATLVSIAVMEVILYRER